METIELEHDLDRFQRLEIHPNRRSLGAKARQDLPQVLADLAEANPDHLLLEIEEGIAYLGGYEITMEDIELRRVEQEGYVAATIPFDDGTGEQHVSLVLDMAITEELLSKGLAQDIIRRIQQRHRRPRPGCSSHRGDRRRSPKRWHDLLEHDWTWIQARCDPAAGRLIEGPLPEEDLSFEVDGVMVHIRVRA